MLCYFLLSHKSFTICRCVNPQHDRTDCFFIGDRLRIKTVTTIEAIALKFR
ncbi:MAG: hypothetical protein RMY28_026850 [Nostoc sp. ChiSLP01]|nr:hypothetical protein [Nostoc sp. CmiSLP01]MDZ8288733.1 hypothetical protein [Nostoc sp. ChiSLP01]